MQCLFARADWEGAGAVARLVAELTYGPYYHVEVRFADERCFSSQYPEGVRFKSAIDTSDPLQWDVVNVSWRETPAVVAWCESQVGAPYDMRGAINSGIGVALANPNAWFCSEIVSEVLSRCGCLGIPTLISPNNLYAALKRIMAGTIASDQVFAMVQEICRQNREDDETESVVA